MSTSTVITAADTRAPGWLSRLADYAELMEYLFDFKAIHELFNSPGKWA